MFKLLYFFNLVGTQGRAQVQIALPESVKPWLHYWRGGGKTKQNTILSNTK